MRMDGGRDDGDGDDDECLGQTMTIHVGSRGYHRSTSPCVGEQQRDHGLTWGVESWEVGGGRSLNNCSNGLHNHIQPVP